MLFKCMVLALTFQSRSLEAVVTVLFDYMRSEFPSESEITSLVAPFRSDLASVWVQAWDSWAELPEEHRRRLGETATVPPITIYGFAQSFAKEVFLGRESEGITICDAIPGVFGIYIEETILLRFNSLCRGHVVSLVSASPLKKMYFHQEPIRGLINSATRLTVGYRQNAAHTELTGVELSLQLGDDLLYYIPLDDADDNTVAISRPESDPNPHSSFNPIRKAKAR